jgi:chaperone BCS1
VIENHDRLHQYTSQYLEKLEWGGCSQRVRTDEETTASEEAKGLKTNNRFNRVELESNKALRYCPDANAWFFHEYWLFWLTIHKERTVYNIEKHLIIRCLGWSHKPIEKLLRAARDDYMSHNQSRILVYSPAPKPQRAHSVWKKVNSTHRRLQTVILPEGMSENIVNDANDFLRTRKWYEERGIPHRRGYVFYGPGGTGKTSTALGLASHFRVPLYKIPLGDRSLTDAELLMLFQNLPQHCIVLLEDVDASGIGQNRSELEETPDGESTSTEKSSSLTLSGLLDGMDGVTSSEGRILIMTTNHLNVLDDALLRPGRVDRRFRFNFMTTEQNRRLFMLMCGQSDNNLSDSRLRELANKFSKAVPENLLVSAAVQGYLLMWKEDPEGAVEGLDDWKSADYKVTEENTRVVIN